MEWRKPWVLPQESAPNFLRQRHRAAAWDLCFTSHGDFFWFTIKVLFFFSLSTFHLGNTYTWVITIWYSMNCVKVFLYAGFSCRWSHKPPTSMASVSHRVACPVLTSRFLGRIFLQSRVQWWKSKCQTLERGTSAYTVCYLASYYRKEWHHSMRSYWA